MLNKRLQGKVIIQKIFWGNSDNFHWQVVTHSGNMSKLIEFELTVILQHYTIRYRFYEWKHSCDF